MRKALLVLAALIVMASPALAGGGVDLYGAYGEVAGSEYELGIGARLNLGGVHWMVDIAATGFAEVSDETVIDGTVEDDSIRYRVFELGLRYMFYDGHKLRPYLGGGVGWAQASATYASLDGDLGLYALAGLRYGKRPGINFMGEVIYRWAELTAKYGLTDQTDVEFGGFGLQAGISFVF